jgi:hypothetical protein
MVDGLSTGAVLIEQERSALEAESRLHADGTRSDGRRGRPAGRPWWCRLIPLVSPFLAMIPVPYHVTFQVGLPVRHGTLWTSASRACRPRCPVT